MQQDVQTDATCNIQQCCVRLHVQTNMVTMVFILLFLVTVAYCESDQNFSRDV